MFKKLLVAFVCITISCSLQAQTLYSLNLQSLTELTHQIYCITDTVYHEARGEPEAAQAAVARVVLNRARYPATFGNSICKVVYQHNQFSWTRYQKLSWTRYQHNKTFAKIEGRVAVWMFADQMGLPYVHGNAAKATFFSNTRPRASGLVFAGAIGHLHFFYNNRYLPPR